MHTLRTNRRRALHVLPVLLAMLLPMAAVAPAQASNMAKVDIVAEGIDLEPIYVNSRSSGYTGSEDKAHRYMVRVFAKAAGQNRVWRVAIFGKVNLFTDDVGRSDGWPVYGKSHDVWAKPGSLNWQTTPKTACDNMMKDKLFAGMTKAQVLREDRKTTAVAYVSFGASADSKANNRKDKHTSGDAGNFHQDKTAYPVQVVCRAAL